MKDPTSTYHLCQPAHRCGNCERIDYNPQTGKWVCRMTQKFVTVTGGYCEEWLRREE